MGKRSRDKTLSRLILTLIALQLIVSMSLNLIPPIQASPDWVTETSTTITIENDYYKAEVWKDTTTSYFATVHKLWVKPSLALVTTSGGEMYQALMGHEWQDRESSNQYANFGTTDMTHDEEYEMLVNTGDYVVLYFKYDVGDGSSQYTNMTVYEWHTYYRNQPYFTMSWRRYWKGRLRAGLNLQACYFLKNSWVQGVRLLNSTGQIEHYDPKPASQVLEIYDPYMMMKTYEKYPWQHYYSASSEGIGIIWVDFPERHRENYLALTVQTSSPDYQETQITYGNPSRKLGTDNYGSCFYYVSGDYSDIDTFSSDIFNNEETTTEPNSFWVNCGSFFNTGTQGSGSYGITQQSAGYTPISIGSYVCMEFKGYSSFSGIDLQPYFYNSSGVYFLWNYSNVSYTAEYQGWDRTNVTWTTYCVDEKFKFNYTFELRNDSDTLKVKGTIELLEDANVKQLRLLPNASPITTMNTSVRVYGNTSDVYSHHGIAMMNRTPYDTYFDFIEYNSGDVWYTAGETWTFEYWIQHFRFYDPTTYWALTDWLNWGDSRFQESHSFSINLWNTTNSFNEDFRVKDVNPAENIVLIYHNYADERLTMVFDGTGTQTFKVYVGDKGEPLDVTGASSWSYDSAAKICTIAVQLSSTQTVALNWKEEPAWQRLERTYPGIYYATLRIMSLIPIIVGATVLLTALAGKGLDIETLSALFPIFIALAITQIVIITMMSQLFGW